MIQELAELFGKLKFFDIVHEYQQGLYFRSGRVKPKMLRRSRSELAEIITEEEKVYEALGGKKAFAPFRRPVLPEGYRRSFVTGMPLHPKRYERSKVLRPGIYFNIPVLDSLVIECRQEKVINLGDICVPTTDADSKVVNVSCNIRYELLDFYKAYTAVHDYEKSLKDYTLSILAKHSRGRMYEDWKKPQTVEELEKRVLHEMRKVVTGKWGLAIHSIYVTDNAGCNLQRILHEGPPLVVNGTSQSEDGGGTTRAF